MARRAGKTLAVHEVAGLVVGDAERHRTELLGTDARLRKEFGDVADLRPETADRFMIDQPFQQLFVFLERAAAAGAVGHDEIDVQGEEKGDVDPGETPGGFALPFGQMGRPAALDLPRRDDIETLLGEDAGRLAGDLREDQAHRAAEEEADAAPFFAHGGDHLRDLQAQRRGKGRQDPLHFGEGGGQDPVDPETANRPLKAEPLVEPGGQQGGFHQRGRREHPLQDKIPQHPGREGRGVENLRLAPAELHDRSDADPRRTSGGAGLAVEAEKGLVPDGGGEFQTPLRDGAGKRRPAPGARSLPVRQRVGGADREAEAAAHALENGFVIRGVLGMKMTREALLSHLFLPESAIPPEPLHRGRSFPD